VPPPPAVARAAVREHDAARIVAVALLQVGEGGEACRPATSRGARPFAAPPSRRAGGVDQRAASQGRPRCGRYARLLEHERQVERREPEPPSASGTTSPIQPSSASWRRARAATPSAPSGSRARAGGRALAREELARRALERLLLSESPKSINTVLIVHQTLIVRRALARHAEPALGDYVLGSARCPTDDEPSEYMKSSATRRRRARAGAACGAARTSPGCRAPRRAMSWFSSVVTSLLTDAEMPGGRLRSRPVSCR